ESERGARVFFAEAPEDPDDEMGRVIARVLSPDWLSIIAAEKALIQLEDNGDKFLVLVDGHRYDIKPEGLDLRLFEFERYGLRMESKGSSIEEARRKAEEQLKARPTLQLLAVDSSKSWAHIMWRLALPIAAFNLALLALPLGASNPRLGRSGDILIAGLVGMIYMNLINLSRSWISSQQLSFELGVWLVHVVFTLIMVFLMWKKLRVAGPRKVKKSA